MKVYILSYSWTIFQYLSKYGGGYKQLGVYYDYDSAKKAMNNVNLIQEIRGIIKECNSIDKSNDFEIIYDHMYEHFSDGHRQIRLESECYYNYNLYFRIDECELKD